mgnify:CR=1 FL=1
MARKTYRGKDVDVSFDLDTCIHAGECVRGLPAVFDTKRRPWILPDGASADDVRDVVARCPSGALELEEHGGGEAEAAATEIQLTDGGPLIVSGAVCVKDVDGTVIKEGAKLALCRCTKSGNQPFCDGSHAR